MGMTGRTSRVALLGSTTGRWLGGAVSALVVLYAYVLVVMPDKLFADDSYFYFQVAWNFARGKGSTFNNIMPTNGYHPVWLLVCSVVFRVFSAKVRAIHAIGGLIATIQVTTLWVVRRIVVLVGGDLWPIAFLLLLPFCFLSQLGTEGPLSGLLLSLVMLLGYELGNGPESHLSWWTSARFHTVAAIAVLTRLDNIFIVGCVWIALWWTLGVKGRRLQMFASSIYLAFWGVYLTSNWLYFGTFQPISGLLKSNSRSDHTFGSNLPHTALIALTVILIGMAIMAWKSRDAFFFAIEAPFALGVFLHAAYITLRMSNETRWSWYYTSWILLASILLARVGAIVVTRRSRLAGLMCGLCVLVMAGLWVKLSYRKFYLGQSPVPPVSFNQEVYIKAGIRRAFAYDQPGMLAYYSNVQIVPLDGLMGNLAFQHDLAVKGLKAVMKEERIDGFIGPPMPMSDSEQNSMCEALYLSTEQFLCMKDDSGAWQITGVDIYARVPSRFAGTLALSSTNIIWNERGLVAVWRVDPSLANR